MLQIDKSTLTFLKKLKQNNNRDWFAANKTQFSEEQTKIKAFHHAIKEALNTHDCIEKYKLYRIYRDLRFSKDKTPYQPHFAAAFSRYGAALRGTYYLRIRPGESFLAGGFWEPNKDDILRIRKEFEIDASPLREILKANDFQKIFGRELQGNSLKTAPRGFDKTHPDIDLIRKKGFVAIRKFTDKEVLAADFLETVSYSFNILRPFFDYMSEVLTTDLNGETIISD